MKVLQVITDTDRRGAQVYATDLADGFREIGIEVDTVGLAPGTSSARLDVPVLGPTRRSWRTVRELRRRAVLYDVTIAHGSTTLPICAMALAGTGASFIYRQISDPLFWASSRSRRVRTALLLRRTNAIVALSDGSREVVRQHYRLRPRSITVIPNAVPDGAFTRCDSPERFLARNQLGIPRGHPLVAAYVGALVPEKGVDDVIRSIAESPPFHLVVAGDGPDRTRLQELADELLGDRVSFLGGLTDPVPVYHASDVVLLLSKGGDSMPAVLIEAGLCGVPAIATAVGAITDVVRPNDTGWIVEHGGCQEATTILNEIASDPALAAEFGEASRKHCRAAFTIAVNVRQWKDLISSITNSPVEVPS